MPSHRRPYLVFLHARAERERVRDGGLNRWEHASVHLDALISSAPFSPTAIDGMLVFDEGIVGKIEESTTRNPPMPRTATTAASTPILHVPHMCHAV